MNFSEWWQSLLSPIARERTGNKHQSQTQSSEEPLGGLERTPRWLSAGFQKRSWGPGSFSGHSLREFSFGFLKQVHCLTEHFCQLLPVLIFWQLNSMLFCKRVGKRLMVWYQQLLNSSVFPLRTRGWQWDTAPCPGPALRLWRPRPPSHKHTETEFLKENMGTSVTRDLLPDSDTAWPITLNTCSWNDTIQAPGQHFPTSPVLRPRHKRWLHLNVKIHGLCCCWCWRWEWWLIGRNA